MTNAFLQILDLSLTACPVILAVLLLRLLLRRTPKKYSFLLWGIVALRLCLPLDMIFQSPFSLFNLPPVQTMTEQSRMLIVDRIDPPITTPAENTRPTDPVLPDTTPSAPQTLDPNVKVEVGHAFDPAQIAAMLWLTGLALLLSRGTLSYIRLRRQMATATRLEGCVFESDHVRSPFILGFFRPRIYIPYELDENSLRYILAHEREHICHLDHLLRPYAWLLLCVHWFNPLVWLCYFLMGRDMEMRIDEAVLQRMPESQADYSATLLAFAAPRTFPSPISPCLGESAVGNRIKHILRWKKPALWLSILAVLLCITAIVVCLSNPVRKTDIPIKNFPYAASYDVRKVVYASEKGIRSPWQVTITNDGILYVALDDDSSHILQSNTMQGPLLPLDLSKISDCDLLEEIAGSIDQAWYTTMTGVHYYFLHATDGTDYLARGAKGITQSIVEMLPNTRPGRINEKLYLHDISRHLGMGADPLNRMAIGDHTELYAFTVTRRGTGLSLNADPTDIGFAVYDLQNGYGHLLECHLYPGAATGDRIYLADDPITVDGITYDVLLSWNNPDFVCAEWQKNGETVLTESFIDQLNTLTIYDRTITEGSTLLCYDANGNAIDLNTGRDLPAFSTDTCVLTDDKDRQYDLPWFAVEPSTPFLVPTIVGMEDSLPILATEGDSITFTIDPSWNIRALTCNEDIRWEWNSASSKGGSGFPPKYNATRKNGVFTYTIKRGDSEKMESAICCIAHDGGSFWFEVRFLRPLQTLTSASTATSAYLHLNVLFPEYTQITGLVAKHDLDPCATADPEQVAAFLELLDRCASFDYEEIHFTEVILRGQTGEYHFKVDLGAQTCELYTASVGRDALLFDFGNGNLRAYAIDQMCESYRAWCAQDEKNSLSTQFRLLRDAICDGVDNSIQLNEPRGGATYINPTKIAGELARQGISRAIAENSLYTGEEVPNYNLEIIMDGKVYICDDELNVFYVKHKEDIVYKVPFPDCLNYDKTRPDWPIGCIVDLYQQ